MSSSNKFAVGYLDASELGGWLLFLIIVLSFDPLLYVLGAIAGGNHYAITIWNSFLAALTFSAAYLLASKNAKGVLLAKLYFAVTVLVRLVAEAHLGTHNVIRTAASCGVAVCYFLYLTLSTRVQSIYFLPRNATTRDLS